MADSVVSGRALVPELESCRPWQGGHWAWARSDPGHVSVALVEDGGQPKKVLLEEVRVRCHEVRHELRPEDPKTRTGVLTPSPCRPSDTADSKEQAKIVEGTGVAWTDGLPPYS